MKIVKELLILLIFKVFIVMGQSEKRVPETLWSQRCERNSLALNDCNWCRCQSNLQYKCTARVCSYVDMFGHFNDAIRETDVGMEGKGVWRSVETACEPGVHYRKGRLLCVCTEDGKWPSPVCRDVFQFLHSVIPTKFEIPDNQTCSPTKLYQIGCNVCYCSESGEIDASFCTKRNCTDDIAVQEDTHNIKQDVLDEVYAECERAKKYQIGCKTCVCLPSNRLLCDNCTSIDDLIFKVKENNNNNLCTGKSYRQRFVKDCNICYCDQKDIIYCTVFKCLKTYGKNTEIANIEYESVDPPIDDHDCVPATKYNRDCNTCHCFMLDGLKFFGCTLNNCYRSEAGAKDTYACVEGTKYEKNCLICQCINVDGEITELCTFNENCRDKTPPYKDEDASEVKSVELRALNSMHGYCEPLHVYSHDCNKCRCMSDGKTVACTSKICVKALNSPKPVVVEFIPFIQKHAVCPKGQRYKVDCNICYCMSNGNALCTTSVCKSKELLLN